MWLLSPAVTQTCFPRGHSAGNPAFPAGMPASRTSIWSHLEEQDAALEPTKQTLSDTSTRYGGGGLKKKKKETSNPTYKGISEETFIWK